jgi:hypothetical protein
VTGDRAASIPVLRKWPEALKATVAPRLGGGGGGVALRPY